MAATAQAGAPELMARNLSVYFEGLSALEKVDLAVKRDEILA